MLSHPSFRSFSLFLICYINIWIDFLFHNIPRCIISYLRGRYIIYIFSLIVFAFDIKPSENLFNFPEATYTPSQLFGGITFYFTYIIPDYLNFSSQRKTLIIRNWIDKVAMVPLNSKHSGLIYWIHCIIPSRVCIVQYRIEATTGVMHYFKNCEMPTFSSSSSKRLTRVFKSPFWRNSKNSVPAELCHSANFDADNALLSIFSRSCRYVVQPIEIWNGASLRILSFKNAGEFTWHIRRWRL